ncbi:MAG TPA: rod shape-determining protein, partial [Anaerolineae bacterium]|nr:rod shape-determining protein [Anaerolineae bacterium]
MEQGIALAGGGALLQGLAQRLSDEVKVRVWVAPDPLTAVAIGCGKLLENLDVLRNILQSVDRSRRRIGSSIRA